MGDTSDKLGKIVLTCFELCSMLIIYPVAFQFNDTLEIYVGTLAAALCGLVLSFMAFKSRAFLLTGFISDFVLIILPSIPHLHAKLENQHYIFSEAISSLMLWVVIVLGATNLILRVILSVLVLKVSPELIEHHSLYTCVVSPKRPLYDSYFEVEAPGPKLVQKKEHPLFVEIDNRSPNAVALYVKKICIILSFLIAFIFIAQILHSFFVSTLGPYALSDMQDYNILMVAYQSYKYLLVYGLSLVAFGVISLFAICSKPTRTRLLLFIIHSVIFAIISCIGASFVYKNVSWRGYIETHHRLHPNASVDNFGFHFDVLMTSLTAVMAASMSIYGFIELRFS